MILQNQFAGFFVIEAPEEVSSETIRKELTRREESNGLTIHVRSLEGDPAAVRGRKGSFSDHHQRVRTRKDLWQSSPLS